MNKEKIKSIIHSNKSSSKLNRNSLGTKIHDGLFIGGLFEATVNLIRIKILLN